MLPDTAAILRQLITAVAVQAIIANAAPFTAMAYRVCEMQTPRYYLQRWHNRA
jgi:hypothetical protein